ncbi:MAG: RNA polymerase factor sigma-54 [Desulfovibrionales bacterium]
MGLELRQQLKLSQQLVMTPQLQQAIKLLQMSRLELLETVSQELLENPLLEEGLESGEAEQHEEQKPSETEERPATEFGDEDLMRTTDWEDYLGEFSSMSRQSQSRESEIPEEMLSLEARLSAKPSLEAHLHWQLRFSKLTDTERAVGEEIIGNLDSAGYFQASVEDITAVTGCEPEMVERVLNAIQHFDPVGVASRTVQECLLIQCDFLGHDDPTLRSIITDHLEDIEKRNFKALTRKLHIRMEDIKVYLDIIQTLEPMPGGSYGGSEAQYVSPDVFVYRYEDDFIIVLNEEGLPKLQLSPFYAEELRSKKNDCNDYLQDKLRAAQWLMKSLYQRQRTLFKVTESIVRFQREFFENGVTDLHPLILRDVAEDIGMHESTVSRITTSKYVATPHGIFELKFFFNSALEGEDGGQIGSESVKAAIKRIVGGENPRRPLSDERIASILKEELQVNIARRTVAKYRSALKIASSSKRKQIF